MFHLSVIAPNAMLIVYGIIFGGIHLIGPNAMLVVYGIIFGGIHLIAPNGMLVVYGIIFGGIHLICPNVRHITISRIRQHKYFYVSIFVIYKFP